jgi:hypothetical protein
MFWRQAAFSAILLRVNTHEIDLILCFDALGFNVLLC